jgi:hypothetical protein
MQLMEVNGCGQWIGILWATEGHYNIFWWIVMTDAFIIWRHVEKWIKQA